MTVRRWCTAGHRQSRLTVTHAWCAHDQSASQIACMCGGSLSCTLDVHRLLRAECEHPQRIPTCQCDNGRSTRGAWFSLQATPRCSNVAGARVWAASYVGRHREGGACGLHMHVHGAICHACMQSGSGRQRTWLRQEALGQEELGVEVRVQSALQ